MESLDSQLGRAIDAGKKKCRNFHMGAIPFSPEFKDLSNKKRLWELIRKKKVGKKISSTTIRRLASKTGIQQPLSLPYNEILFQLKRITEKYKAFIPHAPTARQKFCEELAEANAKFYNRKKEQIIKHILNSENSRQQHKLIKRYFPNAKKACRRV